MNQYIQISTAWLHNTPARCNSRMYYIDDILYSYGQHYAIARIDRETNLALFNCTNSSPTTNRHKSIVERTIRAHAPHLQILEVPEPLKSLEQNHITLREYLQRAIQTATSRMIKPNMLKMEEAADRFDALANYLHEDKSIINTKVYTDYLALQITYNTKRNTK